MPKPWAGTLRPSCSSLLWPLKARFWVCWGIQRAPRLIELTQVKQSTQARQQRLHCVHDPVGLPGMSEPWKRLAGRWACRTDMPQSHSKVSSASPSPAVSWGQSFSEGDEEHWIMGAHDWVLLVLSCTQSSLAPSLLKLYLCLISGDISLQV